MFKELLKEKIEILGNGPTSLEEVIINKMTEPMAKMSGVLPPSICLIAQGEKSVQLGDKSFTYNANEILLGSVNVPVVGELKEASKENPYYGMGVIIDPVIISELLMDFDHFNKDQSFSKADSLIVTTEFTDEIKDPIIRLLKIIDNPIDLKILGKQYLREIYYQILKSDAGSILKNSAIQHSKAHQITPIIHYMEKHLQEDMSIEDLKRQAGMSSSSLHETFKEMTGLSPMQYVKRLRLNHANELLLSGSNVSEAAINSGYNSTTQFSREFKRQYGISPSKVA